MIENVHSLQSKYRQYGVILDSNLFLLLLIGLYDVENIRKYKITQKYKQDDFYLLLRLLEPFKSIITTPSILAEVSNLSGNTDGRFGDSYFDHFIEQIQVCEEVYPRSSSFVEQAAFRRLGLTDAGIIYAAQQGKYLVLTDDLPLTVLGQELGAEVINFTPLREYLL